MHELIKGGSLMCTGGSQKCIDGSHGVKYSLIHLKTIETLNEMKVFVMSDTGKMGAVTGAHDDMVSALWLAIQGLKSPYWYI